MFTFYDGSYRPFGQTRLVSTYLTVSPAVPMVTYTRPDGSEIILKMTFCVGQDKNCRQKVSK